MPLRFSNHEPIEALREGDYRGAGREIRDGRRISAVLCKDPVSFQELYRLWLVPCIEVMRVRKPDLPSSEEILSLFFQDENVPGQEEFESCFRSFILGTPPCGMRPPVWNMTRDQIQNIFHQVEEMMEDGPSFERLRVKIICILCASWPEDIFLEGNGWAGTFIQAGERQKEIDVSEGDHFLLSFEAEPEDLTSAILRGPKEQSCGITIDCFGGERRIFLPPGGFLRVLLSKKEGIVLTGIKGNLSFNGTNEKCAVAQAPSGIYYVNMTNPKKIFVRTPFEEAEDVSADGEGGIRLIQGNGIYDTLTEETIQEKHLPIRTYAAGSAWAFQYADGRLASNLDLQGKIRGRVLSVVEDADRALLIRDEKGAFRAYGRVLEDISDEEFVRCMLERFQVKGLCEQVYCTYGTLSVDQEGGLL